MILLKSQRILLILNILKRKTNKTHGITISGIQDLLEREENIQVNRITVANDLDFLREDLGYPIIKKSKAHNKAYYYLIPEFGNSEIRVLLDSLGANKFAANEDKKKLAQHILNFASEVDQKKLRNIVKTTTAAEEGQNIIYALEKIHEAIEDKRYITFEYGKYHLDKKMYPTGKSYKVVPQEIYYFDNRYYLIALKEGESRHFRIDRILGVCIGEYHCQTSCLDLTRYDLINFDMFGASEIEEVQLKVHNSLLDSAIERFGKAVNIKSEFANSEYFILTEELGITRGLVRWILKQGSSIQVIYPQKLKDKVIEEISKMAKLYE